MASRSRPMTLDCTLRDGSYLSDFRVPHDAAVGVLRSLNDTNCEYVEIGHGLGIGAGRMLHHDLPLSDENWYEIARQHLQSKAWGCFVLPEFASESDIARAARNGADFLRFGVDCGELERAAPLVEAAKAHGLRVFVNLLKCERTRLAVILDAAEDAYIRFKPNGIYFVDSYGGLLPSMIATLFGAAVTRIPTELGFHGHDNLHLAIANSLQAFDSGADLIDVTLAGVGRGAGNTSAEAFAAALAACGGAPAGAADDWLRLYAIAQSVRQLFSDYERVPEDQLIACALGEIHTAQIPEIRKLAADLGIEPANLMADRNLNQIKEAIQ